MDCEPVQGLCPRCQCLSLEELVSPNGMTVATHQLQPNSCSVCNLIFQAIESCECDRKCEHRQESPGQSEYVWRETRESHYGTWDYDPEEPKTFGKHNGPSLRKQARVTGSMAWDTLHMRRQLRDGSQSIRLWLRPIDGARSLMTEAEQCHGNISEIKTKLKGLTVCYGDTQVIKNLGENWPALVVALECGRDPVLDAVLSRTGKEYVPRHLCTGGVNFMAKPGSTEAAFIEYTQPPDVADSDVNYALTLGWIRECIEHHHLCKRPPYFNPHLPSRLIDVMGEVDDHQLKLVDWTENQDSKSVADKYEYVALSYCWGNPVTPAPAYHTSIDNIEERKFGFSDVCLPQTIRDAVRITRRLGVRYLWVDALCILQGTDDRARNDWKAESARMHHVYGGALLTIAAASAASAHDGIFNIYDTSQAAPTVNATLTDVPHFDNLEVLANPLSPINCLHEPLYHRGWTLQERILSSRVLIYTRNQLHWECQTATMTQSGTPIESINAMRIPVNPSVTDLHDRWQVLLTDYSARDVTMPSDKLPAIAGLAQAFHERLPDYYPAGDYLAGLWKGTLLDDLLWAQKPIAAGRRVEPGRPAAYRAPSWSWAALDGNIRYYWAAGNGKGMYHARLIEAATTPEDPSNIFGEVSAGELVLHAPLYQLPLPPRWSNGENHSWVTIKTEEGKEVETRFTTYYDYYDVVPPSPVEAFSTGQKEGEGLDATGMTGYDAYHYNAVLQAGYDPYYYNAVPPAFAARPRGIFFLHIKNSHGLLLTPVDRAGDDGTEMAFTRVGVASASFHAGHWGSEEKMSAIGEAKTVRII